MTTAHFKPFPDAFEHKGEYRIYDRAWNHVGFSAEPQYPGQMPVTYPLDATLVEIQLGGYLR